MSVKPFDTVDEMLDYLAEQQKAERTAAKAYANWIAQFHTGDYYVTDSGYGDIFIYGELIDSPYEEDREQLKNSSYHLVRAYSQMCPDGEMGTTSITRMALRITKKLFELAKAQGWPSGLAAIAMFQQYPDEILGTHPDIGNPRS